MCIRDRWGSRQETHWTFLIILLYSYMLLIINVKYILKITNTLHISFIMPIVIINLFSQETLTVTKLYWNTFNVTYMFYSNNIAHCNRLTDLMVGIFFYVYCALRTSMIINTDFTLAAGNKFIEFFFLISFLSSSTKSSFCVLSTLTLSSITSCSRLNFWFCIICPT